MKPFGLRWCAGCAPAAEHLEELQEIIATRQPTKNSAIRPIAAFLRFASGQFEGSCTECQRPSKARDAAPTSARPYPVSTSGHVLEVRRPVVAVGPFAAWLELAVSQWRREERGDLVSLAAELELPVRRLYGLRHGKQRFVTIAMVDRALFALPGLAVDGRVIWGFQDLYPDVDLEKPLSVRTATLALEGAVVGAGEGALLDDQHRGARERGVPDEEGATPAGELVVGGEEM